MQKPIDMKEILVDKGFVPGDVKEIIVGPANDRPGAVKLGNINHHQEEAKPSSHSSSRLQGEIPIVAKMLRLLGWFPSKFGF